MSGISIIIPTYNHHTFLDEALSSVASQTIPPDEVVIVNDGSTDETLSVISRWESRLINLKVINNEQNVGIEESMKRALAASTQTFFISLGDDDPLIFNAIEKLRGLLALNPELSFACCEYRILYEDGTAHPVSLNFSDRPRFFNPQELLQQLDNFSAVSFPTSCALWRKSALIEAGGYRPSLKWCCDWFAAWVIILRYGIAYSTDCVQTIRRKSNSYSERGQRDPKLMREVVLSILQTLELPELADVREGFKSPAILSRYGTVLLRELVAQPQYHQYLSDRLIQNAFAAKGYPLDDNEIKMLMQNLRVSACELLLRHVGEA